MKTMSFNYPYDLQIELGIPFKYGERYIGDVKEISCTDNPKYRKVTIEKNQGTSDDEFDKIKEEIEEKFNIAYKKPLPEMSISTSVIQTLHIQPDE